MTWQVLVERWYVCQQPLINGKELMFATQDVTGLGKSHPIIQ